LGGFLRALEPSVLEELLEKMRQSTIVDHVVDFKLADHEGSFYRGTNASGVQRIVDESMAVLATSLKKGRRSNE
jgi:hypothetical protein